MNFQVVFWIVSVILVSSAYEEVEEPCNSENGKCLPTGCCEGANYEAGKCPSQPADIKCCFSRNICDASAGGQGPCGSYSRAQWGARSPKCSYADIPDNLPKVFIHHTAGASCSSFVDCSSRVRQVQDGHMDDNNWCDIGYSFLVGGDGAVYEGRGLNKQGAHTPLHNADSYGISFMGLFTSATPTDAAIKAAQDLIKCLTNQGAGGDSSASTMGQPAASEPKVSPTYKLHGHRQAKCTACPGDALFALISSWSNFQGGQLAQYSC